MDLPAVAFLGLALWAAFSKGPLYVLLPWIMLPMGAMAVINPALTAGSTVLPSSVAMAMFIVKVGLDPRNRAILAQAATQVRAVGLLATYTAYTVIAAVFLPRLLEGKVMVIGIRQGDDQLYALAPSTANFTQSAYTLLSFLFCIALVGYLRGAETDKRLQLLLRGLYTSGAMLALTGTIDFLGGKAVLDVFRTASYANTGYSEVNGSGRITGAYAEASYFGDASVFVGTFLLMALPALQPGLFRRFVAPLITVLVLALAALSTSSTAYAGLLIFMLCLAAIGLKNLVMGRLTALVPTLLVLGLGLAAVGTVYVAAPAVVESVDSMVTTLILEKPNSYSYKERHFWNETALAAFESSGGLGVGPGAVRASSWPLVILSNLGVPGALTMGLFLILSFIRPASTRSPVHRLLLDAAKVSLLVVVSMNSLSGGVLDPGISVCFLTAMILVCSTWVGDMPGPHRPPVRQRPNTASDEEETPPTDAPSGLPSASSIHPPFARFSTEDPERIHDPGHSGLG